MLQQQNTIYLYYLLFIFLAPLNDDAKEVDNGEEFWWCAVCLPYFQYFHYNFTVTRNASRKVERNEATDRFCSVVFLLNELFVTVHVNDILNTDNNN